jgi:hypothetical protein
MTEPEIIYLGDGVYAQFDGFHVCLIVNDHRNEPVVYLDPGVMEALNDQYRTWTGAND